MQMALRRSAMFLNYKFSDNTSGLKNPEELNS